MKTELAAAEIDELYAFVEKKGVKPLDVQIELVDHLASDIEDVLSHSPQMTFVEALLQVHTKFGSWVFDYLVQQAEDSARRRQEKLFWSLFRDFFRWPKALFTIILTLLF